MAATGLGLQEGIKLLLSCKTLVPLLLGDRKQEVAQRSDRIHVGATTIERKKFVVAAHITPQLLCRAVQISVHTFSSS
jgi:hypothetical protein